MVSFKICSDKYLFEKELLHFKNNIYYKISILHKVKKTSNFCRLHLLWIICFSASVNDTYRLKVVLGQIYDEVLHSNA